MGVFKVGLLVYVPILASFFYNITSVVEMLSNLFIFTTLEDEKAKNVWVVNVETTLKKPNLFCFFAMHSQFAELISLLRRGLHLHTV